MLAALCFCLLLAAASGQQQLDETYLPPGGGDGNNDNVQCPPAKIITSFSNRLVVSTQIRVVSRPVVQFITKTVVSSRVVPSVIVRQSVVRSTVVVPREVVRTTTVVRFVTSTLTVPGAVREVVRTSEQVIRKTDRRQVTTTLETTQRRNSIVFSTKVLTNFVTSTQLVPQVSVFTQRRTVPGPNVVITKTEQVVTTRVVTQPSQPVVSTYVQQDVRFTTIQVPVPGAVRNSVVVRQSQQVIPVESVVEVPQFNTVRVTSTRQYERTLFKTYTSQQVVPVQVTSTSYIDSRIVNTQQVQVTSTEFRVNTDYVTVAEPARDITSVVRNTNVNIVTQPGRVIPVVSTQVVEQIINRQVTSVRVVPNIIVSTKIINLPCRSGGGAGVQSGSFGGPLGGRGSVGSVGFGTGVGGGLSAGGRGQSGRSFGRHGSYGQPSGSYGPPHGYY